MPSNKKIFWCSECQFSLLTFHWSDFYWYCPILLLLLDINFIVIQLWINVIVYYLQMGSDETFHCVNNNYQYFSKWLFRKSKSASFSFSMTSKFILVCKQKLASMLLISLIENLTKNREVFYVKFIFRRNFSAFLIIVLALSASRKLNIPVK